jgi:deoxyribose-phosphate aldolase
MFSKTALAKMIDHSFLRHDASEHEVVNFCEESRDEHFAAVVVFPYWLPVAAKHLRGSDVKLATVVGFPFGATPVTCKVYETQKAVEMGAEEIDMVINLGALRSGHLDVVRREIEKVVTEAEMDGLTEDGEEILVKVIIETGLTSRYEQEQVCKIAEEARADFIKTCTGLGPRGATVEDVKFLRQVLSRDLGIKASGAIRTYGQTLAMVNAGANRIGTSCGFAILKEYERIEQPLAEGIVEAET